MSTNPSSFVGPDRPVEQVSWDDCQDFLKQLDKLSPTLKTRLLSEAEWEYACRAGTQTTTWIGDFQVLGENGVPALESIAWYDGNSGGETQPVKRKSPNQLGLYDMLGNVWEWCTDMKSDHSLNDAVDPHVDELGSNRARRGGSWLSNAGGVRAAVRVAGHPSGCYSSLGFRLARDQLPDQRAEPGTRSGPRGTRKVTRRRGPSR